MRRESKTWLVILLALALALIGEAVTILAWGHPISWAMADAPKIVVFAVGLVGGVLAGHFWWPARSRWRRLEGIVASYGPPHPADTIHRLRTHAAQLWDAYRGVEEK